MPTTALLPLWSMLQYDVDNVSRETQLHFHSDNFHNTVQDLFITIGNSTLNGFYLLSHKVCFMKYYLNIHIRRMFVYVLVLCTKWSCLNGYPVYSFGSFLRVSRGVKTGSNNKNEQEIHELLKYNKI